MDIFEEAKLELENEAEKRSEEAEVSRRERAAALYGFRSSLTHALGRELGFDTYQVISSEQDITITYGDRELVIGCHGADKFYTINKAEATPSENEAVSAKEAAKRVLLWIQAKV